VDDTTLPAARSASMQSAAKHLRANGAGSQADELEAKAEIALAYV
jgi:hypothetical protein